MSVIDFIVELVNWQIVILVISVGEIAKRLYSGVSSFRTVFFSTIPITIVYGYIANWEGETLQRIITSFSFAYFLYPLIVKPLKKLLLEWINND